MESEKKKTSIFKDGNCKYEHLFGNLDLGLKSEDENLMGARTTVATIWMRPWCTVTEPIVF